MADYEGGKVDGVGRTLGGVALGGAGLSLLGNWLGSALQNMAGYIGNAIRGGGGPVPFGGHVGLAAPAAAVGFGASLGYGVEHENTSLRIENANLRTEARILALEKELAFERERRDHADRDTMAFIGSHYVPGQLIMSASQVVTTTPVSAPVSSSTSTPA